MTFFYASSSQLLNPTITHVMPHTLDKLRNCGLVGISIVNLKVDFFMGEIDFFLFRRWVFLILFTWENGSAFRTINFIFLYSLMET
ncbi:hypothetical protein CSE16_18995 [Solibacillus sp. R5-41]|nr:hypothetical protein CSE16_18995 [Solibacillus sp. R5-41]